MSSTQLLFWIFSEVAKRNLFLIFRSIQYCSSNILSPKIKFIFNKLEFLIQNYAYISVLINTVECGHFFFFPSLSLSPLSLLVLPSHKYFITTNPSNFFLKERKFLQNNSNYKSDFQDQWNEKAEEWVLGIILLLHCTSSSTHFYFQIILLASLKRILYFLRFKNPLGEMSDAKRRGITLVLSCLHICLSFSGAWYFFIFSSH